MQYEYYYMQLSKQERVIYRKLHEGIKKYKDLVVFDTPIYIKNDRVIRALEYDHPELYYWDFQLLKTKTRGSETAIKLDYFINREEANKNAPRIEQGIISILDKCNSQYDSEYDRFKSIYDCMARNIDYKNETGNLAASIVHDHTILGVFEKKRAVCDGISKAFKMVLERAGIDCIVVSGARKENGAQKDGHAWNVVWIDDIPCHVDLTWAIEQSNSKSINHDYVGLTDNQIAKDHSIDSLLSIPKCQNEELDYYIRNKAALRRPEELPQYLMEHAKEKPFEINIRLDFECNMEEMEKKAMDFVLTHFVIQGQHVRITTKRRDEQRVLIMAGE